MKHISKCWYDANVLQKDSLFSQRVNSTTVFTKAVRDSGNSIVRFTRGMLSTNQGKNLKAAS